MTSRELAAQRLHDAVARWNPRTGSGVEDVIDEACRALVDGLDSPALRELAGACAEDSYWTIRELISDALAELGIPRPGTVPPGHRVVAGGVVPRAGTDRLRLAVAPAPEAVTRTFQVQVYVNDVEQTSAAAGMGMDPYDLLHPVNRLIATPEWRTVPIARCRCGIYGCGSTDVTIKRDGDVVHWEWTLEVPMNRGVTFPAADYDREVERVAADHSWETPERTAGRLVLISLDHDRLRGFGLEVGWVSNTGGEPEQFCVSFNTDDGFQVFVSTPWLGRDPADLAAAVRATLAGPPEHWPAEWSQTRRDRPGPPRIAAPAWQPRHRW